MSMLIPGQNQLAEPALMMATSLRSKCFEQPRASYCPAPSACAPTMAMQLEYVVGERSVSVALLSVHGDDRGHGPRRPLTAGERESLDEPRFGPKPS